MLDQFHDVDAEPRGDRCPMTTRRHLTKALEKRTASDSIRVHRPRGTPSPRALQAAALRREGKDYDEIAEALGVSRKSVSQYLSDARDTIPGDER